MDRSSKADTIGYSPEELIEAAHRVLFPIFTHGAAFFAGVVICALKATGVF